MKRMALQSKLILAPPCLNKKKGTNWKKAFAGLNWAAFIFQPWSDISDGDISNGNILDKIILTLFSQNTPDISAKFKMRHFSQIFD